jgi:hypothetical protein
LHLCRLTPHRTRSIHENKALASARIQHFVADTTHSNVYAASSTNSHQAKQSNTKAQAVTQAYQQRATEKIAAFDQAFTRNDNNAIAGNARHT